MGYIHMYVALYIVSAMKGLSTYTYMHVRVRVPSSTIIAVHYQFKA